MILAHELIDLTDFPERLVLVLVVEHTNILIITK